MKNLYFFSFSDFLLISIAPKSPNTISKIIIKSLKYLFINSPRYNVYSFKKSKNSGKDVFIHSVFFIS